PGWLPPMDLLPCATVETNWHYRHTSRGEAQSKAFAHHGLQQTQRSEPRTELLAPAIAIRATPENLPAKRRRPNWDSALRQECRGIRSCKRRDQHRANRPAGVFVA